jgi:4-amino-4-deoxy-L-arabinose transferase-like glycosyltransferase
LTETHTAIASPAAATRSIELSVRLVTTAGVAVAVVGGAVLRLWHINALGLNSDEAVYAGQAASIANDHALRNFFPIFRAHPLLFQAILSVPYHFGTSDFTGRFVTTLFGLATVVLVYLIGRNLYGRPAGVAAACVLAAMPYHVIVSRQILLDAPMTFFATLALYFVSGYAIHRRPTWLYAAGAAMGLTFLSKETGVLLLGSIYAFFALTPGVRARLRDFAVALGVMALTILPYPVSLAFAGKTATGEHYLVWQLFRRANHGLLFYPEKIPSALGWLAIVAALAGFVLLRRRNSWRETLLVAWIVLPAAFLEVWPVKGYHYLLTCTPAVALLAGRLLGGWPAARAGRVLRTPRRAYLVRVLLTAVVVGTLAATSLADTSTGSRTTFLAGSGGVPGGREAGEWVRANVPEGATMLALGPSMANIIEFYGHRKVYGLSVSSNPLRRNPSYEPVGNPDLRIRHDDVQYLIWDAYSADRSPFFSTSLLRYADRYHGRLIHSTFSGSGAKRVPTIQIYSVRP